MMEKRIWFVLPVVALLCFSCSNKKKHSDVVSERYIHKYGYDVSPDEWENNQFPGQVVTTLKNGVTVVAAYEDGVLHGQTTYTYPHSQTLETLNLYERGNLIKRISYDIRGMPVREDAYLAPSHMKTKYWYNSGSPMCVEEVADGRLIEGEYYTGKNEPESRVTLGSGVRTSRDKFGTLLSKEWIEEGRVHRRETFFPNGSPQFVVNIKAGKLDGEKRLFAETGEPLSVENWKADRLEGLCTYYQNGVKYLEIAYRDGMKHGLERHYIDGEILSQETEWLENQKHGPSTYYCDGMAKTEYYYNNELVAKGKYDELLEREKMISIMNERAKVKTGYSEE